MHDTTLPFTFDLPTDVPFAFSLTALAEHQSAELPPRGSVVLALDGKTLRGTIPARQNRGVHLLAAFLPEEGVVLAQAAVEHKENEIVVAPTLLARLPLNGVMVVGDALHAQRAISISIVQANGDFLWFIDQNQPTVLDDISQLFVEPEMAKGWSLPPTDFESARSCESGHGRVEERIITVSSMLQDYTPWPYLAQVFKLERRWWDAKGEHYEVRYGLTSLPRQVASPADLLRIARAEWG